MQKITFGLIVGTRGFFNSSLAVNGKKELITLMEKLGYDVVVLPNEATPTGVIETIQVGLFQQTIWKLKSMPVLTENYSSKCYSNTGF